MSRFYIVAVVPAVIALGCVVLAWYILRPMPTALLSSPSTTVLNASPSSSSVRTPTPPVPTFWKSFLPDEHRRRFWDTLTVPRASTRNLFMSRPSTEYTPRHWVLNFASETRDTTMWPTTAHWRADLALPMRNVIGIRVLAASVAATEYTVDDSNQMLDVEINNEVYVVAVTRGLYASGTDLAAAVEAAIVSTDTALQHFTVHYIVLTDRVVIKETTGTAFAIKWRSGRHANTSMWRTLGFDLSDAHSTLVGGHHELAARNRIDLVGAQTLDVFADELRLEVPLVRVQLPSARCVSHTHSVWPIARIAFLTFRFQVHTVRVDDDGQHHAHYRPYNFNGRNNSLQIKFECREVLNPLREDVQLDYVN